MESSVDKLAEQVKGIVAERQQHLDAVAHIDDVLGQLGIEIRGKGRRGRPTRADGMLPKKIGRPKGSKNKPKEAQQVPGAQGTQDELPSKRGRAKLGRRAKVRGKAKAKGRLTKRGRPEPSEPLRKKIGRPKGSKNKPKAVPIDVLGVEAQVQQVQQAQQSVPAEQVQETVQEVHDGLPSRRGKRMKD
jgi:hypothetical protein